MEYKVIRRTPDQLGYKDRGIMKWQGLMLSAHLDELRTMKKEDKKGKPIGKEIMTEKEISKYLEQSYLNKKPVSIQANTLKNGHFYPDVHCIVLGFQDEDIYLSLKDNRKTSCKINQIRNIEFWIQKIGTINNKKG